MARGKKFDKRGGGPRLDAVNAQEIELRNARLAELEEERAQRRAEEEDDEDGDGDDGAAGAGAGEGDAGGKEGAAAGADSKKQQQQQQAGQPAGPVTTEADHKRNMAKLAEVRKRREQAETKRKQEEELAKQMEEERKKLAAMTTAEDDGDKDGKKKKKKSKDADIPKLDKVAIKRMKPAQMKEALKVRGLDIQGNAKSLQERLLKYEANR